MNPVCGKTRKAERSELSNRAAGRWCELGPEQEPGSLTVGVKGADLDRRNTQ